MSGSFPRGAERRLIGRDAELKCLQDTLRAVLEDGQRRVVIVAGESGVGKSRLLQAFDRWCARHAQAPVIFRGQARPEWQVIPYALLRVVLGAHLQIRETDSPEEMRSKLERGLEPLGSGEKLAECAGQLGRLLGLLFDPAPRPVGPLDDTSQLHNRVLACLTDYFRGIAAGRPLLLLLEDLHWSDDSSLNVLERLADSLADQPFLIVATAQPALLERRSGWMDLAGVVTAAPASPRMVLELEPLSPVDSRHLVDEILHWVDEIPEDLRSIIIGHAGGNPLAVESIIHLLIAGGAIIPGQFWRVDRARLATTQVPPTLVGVLRSYLEHLPAAEQSALQRGAVIGTVFWDEAIDFLGKQEKGSAAAALAALQERGIIARRAVSSRAGMSEYAFGHELLREAAYESLAKNDRGVYHNRAAEWLLTCGGERAAASVGLVADHLEQAGQTGRAAMFLARAGEQALRVHAYAEAQTFLARALRLLPQESPARIPLSVQSGKALFLMQNYTAARRRLEESVALAQQSGQPTGADVLIFLGIVAREQGDFVAARAYLEKGLAAAEPSGQQVEQARALTELAWVDYRQGDFAAAHVHVQAGLALARSSDQPAIQARALSVLAAVIGRQGKLQESRDSFLECLELSRKLGDYQTIAAVLNNLGWNATMLEEYGPALRYFEEAAAAFSQAGNRQGVAYALTNQGHAHTSLGSYATARSCYRRALKVAMSVGAGPNAVGILGGLARVLAYTGRLERAAELLGLVLTHPSLHSDAEIEARATLAHLRGLLPPEAVEAGLARGRARRLEEVAGEVLNESY